VILKVENLSHVYGIGTPFEKCALNDINLEIEKGEFIGLIGHTGSGKSTLIRHFNGLERPQQGKVYLNGKDIWENPKEIRKVRFQVGLVFQYPEHQLFEETVYSDIAFGPKNMGLDEEEIKRRVYSAMEFVGFKEKRAQKSPFELSGGQKRRVAIAGVIAMEPDILILDEPTAGLDPKGRDDILTKIKEYHDRRGSTVILVSHSMEDIAAFADRVIVLNKGHIVLNDTPKQIFKDPESLTSIGLDIPQIARVFHYLRESGVPVNNGIYTVSQAKCEILKLLSAKEAGR